MQILKLHTGGKQEYLRELQIVYNKKIEEIEQRSSLSREAKEQAIRTTKNEYQKLKRQSKFSLF